MKRIAIFLLILVSCLTVLSAAEDKTPLREARGLIEDGRYAEAAGILEAKKETVPGYLLDDIAYWLAFIDYKQGRYSAAKRGLHEVVRDYTGEDMADDAMLLLGEIKMERGETEKALVTYENLYRHYTYRDTAPEALYRIAEYYLSKGEEEKSIYLLEKIGSEYSQYAEYRQTSEIAERIEERRRQIAEAKRQDEPGKPVIETTPSPAREQLTDEERAERYVERRRFPTEEEKNRIYWFERVIEAGRNALALLERETEKREMRRYLARAHRYHAFALENIGAFDKARESYEAIIKDYPDTPQAKYARRELARCYGSIGDRKTAIEILRQYVVDYEDTRSDLVSAYFDLGYYLYQEGKKEEALDAYRTGAGKFPDATQGQWCSFWVGRILFELGEEEEANAHFKQFLEYYPGGGENFNVSRYMKGAGE